MVNSVLALICFFLIFFLTVVVLRRAFGIKKPTWYCINCGADGYGDTNECRHCGRYRPKEQYQESKPLLWPSGRPVLPEQVEPGSEIEFDRKTGVVTSIKSRSQL